MSSLLTRLRRHLSRCLLSLCLTATLLLLMLVVLLGSASLARAEGLGYDRTRLILTEDDTNASVLIKNDTAQAYLIRPQLMDEQEHPAPEAAVRPPLMKLVPQHAARLRLALDKSRLPQDRETLFWLVSHAFPAIAADASAQRLNFNFVLKMKVLYRPAPITGNTSQAAAKLVWYSKRDKLAVRNDSPYHVTIAGMRVNGKSVDSSLLLAPFSETTTTLTATPRAHLQWLIFNDDGTLESYRGSLD